MTEFNLSWTDESELGTKNCKQCATFARLRSDERLFRQLDFDKWPKNPCIRIRTKVGEHTVSSVFLHYNYGFDCAPLWYETMVWRDLDEGNRVWEDFQQRYQTKAEALAGHEAVVQLVRDGAF